MAVRAKTSCRYSANRGRTSEPLESEICEKISEIRNDKNYSD